MKLYDRPIWPEGGCIIQTIPIQIIGKSGALRIASEQSTLGTQYDNNATELYFRRPEEFTGNNLILLFHDEERAFSPVELGTENRFTLTNALTRTTRLELQVAFEREETVTAHSNVLRFCLRASLGSGTDPVAQWPDPVRQLARNAFSGVRQDENKELVFLNLSGSPVQRLALREDIQIAGATADTLPHGQEATARVEGGQALRFHFGIPQGEPGPQGPKGEKGEPGDLSAHNSDPGAHSLLLAAKADRDGALQKSLNAELVNGWRIFSSLESIGLTPGAETMEQVCEALPNYAILHYSVNGSTANEHHPATFGLVTVTRYAASHCKLEFSTYQTGGQSLRWHGWYAGNVSPAFRGWVLSGTYSGTFTPEFIDSNGKSPGSYNTANTYGVWHRYGNQLTIDVRVSTSDAAPMLEAAATALYVKIPTAIGSDLAVNYGPFPTRAVGFLLPDNYAGSTYAINTRSDLFRLDYMRKSSAEPHRLAAGYITPKMLYSDFEVSFQASYPIA